MKTGIWEITIFSLVICSKLGSGGLMADRANPDQHVHFDLSSNMGNRVWLISDNKPTPRGSPDDKNTTGSGGRA